MNQIETPYQASSGSRTGWLARIRRPHIILVLLAAQFAIVHLLTGAQFLDAPRNMHWGILTFEDPQFLLDGLDLNERNKGFPPEPESLGPRRLWERPYGGLHGWWGPVVPLLFAAVWGLTRSYTLLQLTIPLVGAATVLLTYRLARDLAGPRVALIGAAFLACYPLFREYATVAYSEVFSAGILTVALLYYLRGKTVPAVIFGTLALLSKMDVLILYVGTIGMGLLFALVRRDRSLSIRHQLLALIVPIVLAVPWIWFHYLRGGAASPTQPFSFDLFLIILPMMIELTFYAPWFVALLTFSAIGFVVGRGLIKRTLPPLTTVVLLTWFGLALLVTLVYCATPGAGNSPRIIIPGLPALAILFGAGWPEVSTAWRRRVGIYLVALFATVNLAVIGYHTVAYGVPLRATEPAFAALRGQERGFVLTPMYWSTLLFSRQPTTWFEFDEEFEQNIMYDRDNFISYVNKNPIRYVLLPNDKAYASPEVLAYLAEQAEVRALGGTTLYTLNKE